MKRNCQANSAVSAIAYLSVVIFGLAFWAKNANSQDVKPESPSAQESPDASVGLEIVELKGKLQNMMGNRFAIKADDGTESVFVVSKDTTFAYTGTAETTLLTPGLMVRFELPFFQSGNAASPLAALEVFRPATVKRMSRELLQSQTPGMYPATEVDRGKADKTADRKTASKTAAEKKKAAEKNAAEKKSSPPSALATEPGAKRMFIVGQLRMLQGDKMQVQAGNSPVVVPCDPAMKITVSSGDPFFCQQGDEVTLLGLKNPLGVIEAESVEVQGSKPLGQAPEKPSARNPRQRSKPDGKDKK